MKSSLKISLVTGLLIAAGLAYSQSPMGPMGGGQCDHGMMGEGMQRHGMGQGDPAKMQAMMDKRHAALKAQLKLTPAQEGAWTTFTAAMKPPAKAMAGRPDPAEMAKLTTPERIEKMKAMRAQHMGEMTADMDKRGEAAKVFYAVLTPEQQKVFDAHTMPGHGRSHAGQAGKGMPKQ
jgi:Spy/CpxP family protein refolding chaperone